MGEKREKEGKGEREKEKERKKKEREWRSWAGQAGRTGRGNWDNPDNQDNRRIPPFVSSGERIAHATLTGPQAKLYPTLRVLIDNHPFNTVF